MVVLFDAGHATAVDEADAELPVAVDDEALAPVAEAEDDDGELPATHSGSW